MGGANVRNATLHNAQQVALKDLRVGDYVQIVRAGDVILTGTPDGVVNVDAGDEVVCEIDGIGSLHNTLVGDSLFGR